MAVEINPKAVRVSPKSLKSRVGSALIGFIQSGTGAAFRKVQDKLRETVSFEDFGATGAGAVDDLDALVNAVAGGKRILGTRGPTYLFSDTLTITERVIDFGGATLLYSGPKNQFAMVVDNPTGINGATDVRNFTLKCTDTDTTDRTHGLCLGGSCGLVDNFRIQGFTGISLALGSGTEDYTGVTLPATQQCYYWRVSNFNISSTAGWNLVIRSANNANHFVNVSTFPYNGFSESPPRTANCIDEIVIGGTANTFERVSLEASPSGRMVKFLETAQGNEFLGKVYLERNANWATPPFPRVEALAESSGNRMRMRHPYSGQVVSDLGTANDLRADPSFYVNGQQVIPPSAGVNMVKNGRFENGSKHWSDFSTAGTLSYGAGYLAGKSMRVDVVAGRPNIAQDLVAVGGYQIAGLRDQNITVSGYVRTNLAGLSIKVVGLTQAQVSSDEAWQYFSSTVKVPTATASTVNVQLITEGSGLTGYAEWSDVTAVIGNEPLAVGPRELLEGSATYNPPSLATGAIGATTTVTVTGAALGDAVDAVSFSLDTQGVSFKNAWVSAADTVSVIPENPTAGTIDLASGTLRVWVRKA